jgi:hypothetical protein
MTSFILFKRTSNQTWWAGKKKKTKQKETKQKQTNKQINK